MVKLFQNFFSADNKLFKKLFSGVTPMVTYLALALIATAVSVVNALQGSMAQTAMYLLIVMLVLVVVAYFRHDKNVMKCAMGASLICVVSEWVHHVISHPCWASIVGAVLVVAIYITHLLINMDHHSNPGKVFANQFLCTLLIVFCIVRIVIMIVNMAISGTNPADLAEVADCACTFGAIAIIVNIETNLDNYRIAREAKGWTENK